MAVVIPAFNAERSIAAAVRSALAQPEVSELVVIDDGSNDATGDIARACDDGAGRLKVVAQPNGGPSAACNHGVALTTAPVWCILDADDAFAPHRLGALLQQVGDAWDMAADTVVFQFPGGEERRLRPARPVVNLSLEAFVRGNIPQRKTPRSELGYLQPLKRRAFFDQIGLRFDPSVRFAEDYMFYATALARGARFPWADGPGYVANVTPGSLSHTQNPADYARLVAFDRALLAGCSRAEAAALRDHIHMMALKAQYLRIENEFDQGRAWRGLRMAFAAPSMAGFFFNHRWRPALSRRLKRLAGLDPAREILAQLPPGLRKGRQEAA